MYEHVFQEQRKYSHLPAIVTARLVAGERIWIQKLSEECSTLETFLNVQPIFEVMRATLQSERLERMRERYLQSTALDPILTDAERSFFMFHLMRLREMNFLKIT